jgi:hypothetical protein
MSAASSPFRHPASQPPPPSRRLLRGYAFDPSLATQLDTAAVSEILYKVPWEPLPGDPQNAGAEPGHPKPLPGGPRGEYVEVVDYDPPSGCFYAPVDLDHPAVLAQNGLTPSEGNPQFHQQMVYAVAMTTIDRFERALGRKTMWADRWDPGVSQGDDEFIQRLRIYPHAMRDANAYYSRSKGSLLFGYFPATVERDNTDELPGGVVFTCLSHDIIAHETTHALLDGFHKYFMEATNPDVLAFHEGFADIVALFQHFTFPEQLRHQIAKTRGNLGNENLLAQLATQFGHASGSRGALRDFIGRNENGEWKPHQPKPSDLDNATEVHDRGAILVAAVFEAFLSIYRRRTRDLLRLASGGSGILGQGELHPDLIDRLANEASIAAGHVLDICIRALDYCPPVDLSFGEYLRALVTADMDLHPDDPLRYRVAFIEAFRRRGIYPAGIRTLSEDSLRWSRPEEDPELAPGEMKQMLADFIDHVGLRGYVDQLRYCKGRREIWRRMRAIRAGLHDIIGAEINKAEVLQKLTGLALSMESHAPGIVKVRTDGLPRFRVEAFREARRLRGDGRILNQVFITILQKEIVESEGETSIVRCGSTLVIDLDEMSVSYAISKGLGDKNRIARIRDFQESGQARFAFAQTYYGKPEEVFAALHQH